MKICIIHTYATVQVLEVEDAAAAERQLANKPPPCYTGYEMRVQDPKPRIKQTTGWGSPYRKDLDLDSLLENWEQNQGRDQGEVA